MSQQQDVSLGGDASSVEEANKDARPTLPSNGDSDAAASLQIDITDDVGRTQSI